MNSEGPELAAGHLELPRGMREGHTDLVHVNFVPTRASLRPIAGATGGHVGTSPDAHRFNASGADADAAIAEWRSFVDELRT